MEELQTPNFDSKECKKPAARGHRAFYRNVSLMVLNRLSLAIDGNELATYSGAHF
jgi:hypothetical protein